VKYSTRSAQGILSDGKNWRSKILWHCPLNHGGSAAVLASYTVLLIQAEKRVALIILQVAYTVQCVDYPWQKLIFFVRLLQVCALSTRHGGLTETFQSYIHNIPDVTCPYLQTLKIKCWENGVLHALTSVEEKAASLLVPFRWQNKII
jgi:hypothetical protein